MGRFGLLLVLLAGTAAVAVAKRPPPSEACVTGRFLVGEGTGALLARLTATGALDLAPAAVTLGALCDAVPPRVLRRIAGERVRVVVRWAACRGLRGRVRLRGELSPDCDTFAGKVRAGGFRSTLVTHRSRCGDGRVDTGQGEACDGTAGPCAVCTADCQCETPVCPTGVVGNPATAPVVHIDAPAAGASEIRGRVERADGLRVVGWARTDRFYVQPRLDAPFTAVAGDGTFRFATNPWEQVVVLLVDNTYVVPPASGVDYHPGGDPGVRAWAEYPAGRRVAFAGRCWHVKDSTPHATEPGPMVFAADESHVRVDEAGALHLTVARFGGTWAGAEVATLEPVGYGDFVYTVDSDLVRLPVPLVFSGFLFASLSRELDIEFSRTITASCADPVGADAQFVVQPFVQAGHRWCLFAPAGPTTTHRIRWRADRVEFASWAGATPEPPTDGSASTWTYTGGDVPAPGAMRLRFNLWLVAGILPTHVPHEIVVRGVTFTPAG